MAATLEKVTAFVIRSTAHGDDLLLFEHPTAGIQIPAGTVEDGERPDEAVLREAGEETGLGGLRIRRYLGHEVVALPPGYGMVGQTTTVFAQPDLTGQDWARIRRGILVKVERRSGDSVQVTYEEADRLLDPQYITYRITGWVPDRALAEAVTRHFYHLTYEGPAAGRWEVETDSHCFTLFWAPMAALPPIIPPQDAWLEMLKAVDAAHEDSSRAAMNT
jgi:8-oxo-dGTP pyrophosphatase MutT (NUDIX family)